MDRAELHTLIDHAIDAMSDERCKGEYVERLAAAAVSYVANHNAMDLACKVNERRMTLVEAFDQLTDQLRPLYNALGEELPESQLGAIRERLRQIAGARLN